MNKILRKNKSVLIDNSNEDNIIKVSIIIESNHINNNLDNYLNVITSNIKTLNNYTLKVEEKPEKKKPKPKTKKINFPTSIYV